MKYFQILWQIAQHLSLLSWNGTWLPSIYTFSSFVEDIACRMYSICLYHIMWKVQELIHQILGYVWDGMTKSKDLEKLDNPSG